MAHQGLLKRFARSTAIGALAVSALVIVAPVAGTASATPVVHVRTAPTLDLNGLASVKTSNGVKWEFGVTWGNLASVGGSADLGMDLERTVSSPGGTTGFEFHSWSFSVKGSTLSWNGKTATLNAGTQASPVATAAVTFKETSSKKVACTSGKETMYSGTMSGKATLVTGLSGGGTVSVKTWSKAELTVDSGCLQPLTNPCVPELIAGSGFSGTTVIAGSLSLGGPADNIVGLSSNTTLAAPKGASRQSVAVLIDHSTKVYAKYSGGKVQLFSTGFVAGSGTLSGGAPKTIVNPNCKYKGKKYTTTTIEDFGANYKGHFSAAAAIGGKLVGPATSIGDYIVETVKAG
ncbi:MAG: hypothetical protein ABSE47_07325 [Acidimicrobiales bacterium]